MFLQKQKLVHFKRFETDLRYKLRLLQWNPSKMNQYCARHETRSYWNHASIDRTRCIENRKGFNRRPQWPETLQPVSKMRLSAQALRPPPPESKPKQISSQRKGVPSPPIHYETSKSEESASRNAAGVQLLSRSLHAQIFRHTAPSTSNQKSETISLTHLKNHGLDPDNTQVLPNISFTLPPLEGSNVDEHFYNMGARLAEQTRCLAVNLANNNVPPQPLESVWQHCSGWTKYTRDADGRIVTES
ncbi:DNA-directed DNA polymerase gamma mip1, partial [Serendipita sp. 411]